MDFNNFLEQPLPIIKIDIEKIAINMNDKTEGIINITNIGGGILEGEILSGTECIVLEKHKFFGNEISIKYSLASSVYSNGEFIKSYINIISNGGEKLIPLYITISNFEFLVCEDEKIYDIKEFYQYYLKNYLSAIKIFYSYDFIIWLKRINFKHIDIVEELLQDSNKQRAIDNFFILCRQKQKAKIEILQKKFSFKYILSENEKLEAIIPIKLIGDGYFEDKIIMPINADFIEMEKQKITSKDFDNNKNCYLKFYIDKSKITKPYERKKIRFDKAKEDIIIEIIEKSPIEIILERQYFSTVDKGILKIINNTTNDIEIEIISKDTFVNFKQEIYLIKDMLEIEFDIKLSGFLKAQMEFTRKPNIESGILIKAILRDEPYRIEKAIYIGNSLI